LHSFIEFFSFRQKYKGRNYWVIFVIIFLELMQLELASLSLSFRHRYCDLLELMALVLLVIACKYLAQPYFRLFCTEVARLLAFFS